MATSLDWDRQHGAATEPPDGEPSSRRLTTSRWMLLGAIAVVAGFARDVLVGVQTADESWFLYVLHRVTTGHVLYRDVWMQVFPLAVWIGAAFVKVFGDHVFVLMAVDTLIFAGTVIACAAAAERIAPRHTYTAAVLAMLLGWAGPGSIGPGSLYTALAYALLTGTLAVTLAWIDSGTDAEPRRRSLLLVAAALAGLTFGSKQSIGVLALVALVATVVLAERPRRSGGLPALLAAVLGVYAAAVLATILPVAVSGALPALVRDTLTSIPGGVRQSLHVAAHEFTTTLTLLVRLLLRPSFTKKDWVSETTALAVYLTPFVAVPAYLWALAVKREFRAGVIGIFGLAALAGLSARADYPHFVAVLPFLLLALIFAWKTLRPRIAPVVRVAIASLVAVVTGARIASIILVALAGGIHTSRLAHFEGVPITSLANRPAMAATAELRSAPQQRVYIFSLHAGFLYLASGREDPTPYDYPDGSALGLVTQTKLVEAVKAGRIDAIWFDPKVTRQMQYANWRRSPIADYVLTAMRPASANTLWGRLYVPAGGPK